MKITLVGAGMGAAGTLTAAALEALCAADAVVGAARILAALPEAVRGEKIPAALPEDVRAALAARPERRSVCVALSGDAGFHSGARRLLEMLDGGGDVSVIPGISTPQYFAARLRRPWQDFRLVSAHGADCDVLAEVLNHPAVFFLAGGRTSPASIAETLCGAGLGDARMTAGENLSAPDERISAGTAEEFRVRRFAPLSAVLVENGKTFAREAGSAGIPDGEFIRGGAPMTKREVRAVALSLLDLRPGDIVRDVGAGTGSVAVEAALIARRGRVYAFERDAAAFDLLLRNREKFGVHNMIPVRGEAPGAFADAPELPPPDAVFIGGGGSRDGAFAAILDAALAENPRCRIVAAVIALETLAAATAALRGAGVANVGVVQVAANRAAERAGLHLLEARNPVFLVSGGGR